MSNIGIAIVACSPRSGSTLLTRILNSHSRIASPYEIGLPILFRGDIKEQIVKEKTRKICEHIQSDYLLSLKNPWYLIEQIAKHERKDFLVVKDPRHSIFLHDIHTVYGDIPLIHLTRDVRHVSHSAMFGINYMLGMQRWHEYHSVIESVKSLYSHYLHVRYEDLVADTVKTTTQLVNYLGYEYERGMEEFWNFHHSDDELKLWAGQSPSDSMLQCQLYIQKISTANARPIPTEVLELYSRHVEIRNLNEYYGYKDEKE